MAGDVEREGLAFVRALVCDRGCGRAAVADLELEGLADRLAMGVGRRHRDQMIAEIAVGRYAGDDSGMGIDAEASRHRSREGQGVAGGRSREVAGDVEREGLAFEGALVCDRGCGRATVADLELEGLADRLAVRIGRRHRNQMIAEIAVGRHAGDDARMGVEAEASRHRAREGQVVTCGGNREMAGDVEREGVAFISGLVCDRGCSRAAVADLELEALADRLAMGVGRRHRDRVVAEIAVGRHAGDDAGVGIEAEAGRHRAREGQGVAGGGSREVAGDVEREGLAFEGGSGLRSRLRSGRCHRPGAGRSR